MTTINDSKLEAKAAQLATRYAGNGIVDVASGSEPGKVYHVEVSLTAGPENWTCSCRWSEYGGRNCSHVRAARMATEKAAKRHGRALAWQAVAA